MSKFSTIILIPLLLFMTSCTIDWNDEKDKKIAELERKIEDTSKKIDKNSLETIGISTKKLDFEYDLKCQDRANELKKTGSNIISGYYNSEENKCYLKVFNKETNKIEEGTIDSFGPTNLMPKTDEITNEKINDETYSWIIFQDVNLRDKPTTISTIKRPIIKGELVKIMSNTTIGGQKWYNITTSKGETGWISELGFQKNDKVKSAADSQ